MQQQGIQILNKLWEKCFSVEIISSIVVIIAARILWHFLHKTQVVYLQRANPEGNIKRYYTYTKIFMDIVKYIIILSTALIVLQINGVNVSSFIAGLGLVSAIVGFALQDFLKDMIMGIHMLMDHFFEIGDVVKYGNEEGIVISFNLKTTKLQLLSDGSILSICNRNISELAKASDWLDIDLPLSYEEDWKKINAVLTECCSLIKEEEEIKDCVYKGIQEFADSAIIYKIRIFCAPEKKADMRRRTLQILQEELEKAKISIPYPQMDVHCK
ncbi:MAG: mechanosensitive ion channel family protein [Muricoprocola sp.]